MININEPWCEWFNPFVRLFQKTLTDSQDKAFRRISELKEQSELDKMAKQHVEDNYMMIMEEKNEQIKVLKTQVCILLLHLINTAIVICSTGTRSLLGMVPALTIRLVIVMIIRV